MLNTKIPTNGIKEYIFDTKAVFFHFFDVSGQKESRARWLPYFEGTTDAIIFCVSAAGYCQSMEDDKTVNRLLDSLALFEEMANHPLLKASTLILLLNKIDLLNERLQRYPIAKHLAHYYGTNDSKSFLDFLCGEFKRILVDKKSLYIHATIGIDIPLMANTLDTIT